MDLARHATDWLGGTPFRVPVAGLGPRALTIEVMVAVRVSKLVRDILRLYMKDVNGEYKNKRGSNDPLY